MNNEDRRVRKTRKALQDALAELMCEKELRQITVQELADRADVHRATFYTHYQDVYDLYQKMENRILMDATELMIEVPSHNYDSVYRAVIDYLLENRAIGQMIFGKHGSSSFRQQLAKAMEQRYLEIWTYESPETQITESIRYLTAYHVSGCISILERWVQSGYAESKDEIYRLLQQVNNIFDMGIG